MQVIIADCPHLHKKIHAVEQRAAQPPAVAGNLRRRTGGYSGHSPLEAVGQEVSDIHFLYRLFCDLTESHYFSAQLQTANQQNPL